MAKSITINGIKIPKGEEALVNLNIAKLPSRTTIDIPVYVNRAHEDGPVLLLLAGLHGDEINGVEILRRMLRKNLTKPLRGSVITIPVLNIYGFLNFSRDLPDGKDINRSFPGNTKGSLASRVAFVLMKEIIPQIDYGVDFHTGGASRTNYPQIRCVLSNKKNHELAMAFQPPFLLNSPFRPNSLRKEAAKLGKPIIVYEAGESLRFDEFAITKGIHGTQRLLHHLQMAEKWPKPEFNTITLNKSSWVRARASGLFHSQAEVGTIIKKNQLIGTLTDPFGEFEVKVKSPADSYVIGLNNRPVVNQGDALYHLGIADS